MDVLKKRISKKFCKITLIILVLTFFVIILIPNNSESYLKPTIGACEKDDCIGFTSEYCYGTYKDDIGEFEECKFKCYGILLKMGINCEYKGIVF